MSTPRTDAQDAKTFHSYKTHYDQMWLLARQLETELSAVTAQRDAAVKALELCEKRLLMAQKFGRDRRGISPLVSAEGYMRSLHAWMEEGIEAARAVVNSK